MNLAKKESVITIIFILSTIHLFVHLLPAFKQKIVSLSFSNSVTSQVVYSKIQNDLEIIYDIKTVWQPKIENTNIYDKTTNIEPYYNFILARIRAFYTGQGILWSAAFLGLLIYKIYRLLKH